MSLGEKIKQLRLDKNMTQDDLAKVCYVSRNAVSKWENDKGYPNIDSIKILSQVFHITIDDLLNNEDIIQVTSSIIEEHIKQQKKFKYLKYFCLIVLYLIFQIGLRVTLLSSDPTGGLSYGFIFGPMSMLFLGVIIGGCSKKHYELLILGIISLLLTLIIESIIEIYSNSRWMVCDLVYHILYLLSANITLFFKHIKIIYINKDINKIISASILIVAFILFMFLLLRSINYELNDIDKSIFRVLNDVPLLHIALFSPLLLLEGYWFFISWFPKKTNNMADNTN